MCERKQAAQPANLPGAKTMHGLGDSVCHRSDRRPGCQHRKSRTALGPIGFVRQAIAGNPRARTAHVIAGAVLYLAALGAALGPGPAAAEADGPDYYRVVGVSADDVLNIRAEPDTSAQQVGSIPPGADCVRNLGCRGGLSLQEFTTLDEAEKARRLKENPRWCQIEYRGVTGWVAGRYLAEGACSDKPSATGSQYLGQLRSVLQLRRRSERNAASRTLAVGATPRLVHSGQHADRRPVPPPGTRFRSN